MMKKPYEKPALLCEELSPESMLCACEYRAPNPNEEWQCGFYPDSDFPFKLFAQTWSDCEWEDTDYFYCHHDSVVNVFGS